MTTTLLTGLAALALAIVHVLSPRLRFLDRTPRSIWLSAAGGVSVAYVFVHLLPEIARLQEEAVAERAEGAGAWLAETGLYLAALAGLVTFYGLERMAKRRGGGRDGGSPPAVFALHVGSFALYNAIVAYLLREQLRDGGVGGLAIYTGALGLHALINDRGLYAHHGERYLASGRWALSAAVALGWAAHLGLELPMSALGAGLAFLGGSVVLNVVKEELPAERESRFWAFLLGAAAYAALLLTA
jgi:hypothetical protein